MSILYFNSFTIAIHCLVVCLITTLVRGFNGLLLIQVTSTSRSWPISGTLFSRYNHVSAAGVYLILEGHGYRHRCKGFCNLLSTQLNGFDGRYKTRWQGFYSISGFKHSLRLYGLQSLYNLDYLGCVAVLQIVQESGNLCGCNH